MGTSEEQVTDGLLTLDNVIEWYDRRYIKRPNLYQLNVAGGKPSAQQAKDFISFVRRWFPRLRLLDYGCGNGRYFSIWHRLNFEVVGVEISSEAARIASKNRFGFPIVLNDGRVIPFGDGAFDVVVCSGVLIHVPDEILPELEAEFWRVLKTGGRLFVKSLVARSEKDAGKVRVWRKMRFSNDYLDLFRRWGDIFGFRPGNDWLGWFMFEKGD